MPNGVLDRRLGVSSKSEICQTCGKNIATCPGHFGTIHLVMPVFHIGYINMIIGILRSICKVSLPLSPNPQKCGRCLLSYEDREHYLRKFLNPYTDVLHKRQYNKQVIDLCRKVYECPYW